MRRRACGSSGGSASARSVSTREAAGPGGEEDQVEPERLQPAAPRRVRPASRRAVDRGQRVGGAAQRPEEHRRAELDVREREVLIGEPVLHRGQHRLGRLRPVALRLRARQQQRRRRAGAVVERQLREPRAQLGVAREHRRAGRLDAERRRYRLARVEQPARDAQRVAGLAIGALADEPRELQPRVVRAQHRHRAAHDLAVERVGDAHRPRLDRDQPARLDAGERVDPDEAAQLGGPQRLPEGEQLERARLVAAELREPRADHVDERRARQRAAREPPEPLAVLERALGQRADEQLAHVQRVAAAALVHPAARRALDRRAEHRLDQPAGLRLAQRLELQPRDAGVLPQRLHRVGDRLAAAHRHDDERRAGQDDMQDERRGRGVEQLRVVDAQHDRSAARPLLQAVRHPPHDRQRAVGHPVVGDQRRERAERDGRGAAGRLHPGGVPPSALAAATAWRARLDLPTPAGGADEHARVRAGAPQLRDPRELVVPADQRPFERLRRPVTHRAPAYAAAAPRSIDRGAAGSGQAVPRALICSASGRASFAVRTVTVTTRPSKPERSTVAPR